jgi:hypothetical protein
VGREECLILGNQDLAEASFCTLASKGYATTKLAGVDKCSCLSKVVGMGA